MSSVGAGAAVAGVGAAVTETVSGPDASPDEGWQGGTLPSGAPALVEGIPPVGRFVEAGGVPVHLWESGEGPAVVLLHGANGNLRDWTFGVAQELARSCRVFVPDRPGFGYTGRPRRGGSDPSVQARLLREAVARAGGERPIVVGHSYAGAVALAWALEAPGDTAGIVAVAGATMPFGGVSTIYDIAAMPVAGAVVTRIASAAIGEDRIREFVERAFSPDPVPEGYLEHVGAALATRPSTLRATAEDLSALDWHLRRMRPAYRDLPVPVEILHGTADRTVGFHVHAEPLSRILPVARLTRLENVGHMAHHVATDALAAAIARIAGG